MKRHALIAVLGALSLGGCVTASEDVPLPDGTTQHAVTTKTGIFAPLITTVYRGEADRHGRFRAPMQVVTAAGAQPPETAVLGGVSSGLTVGLGASLFGNLFGNGGSSSTTTGVGKIVNKVNVDVKGATAISH